MARDEALASFSLLGTGDFLRLLSPARKTRGLWVRTPSGVEDARPLWRSVEADDEGPGIEHFTFGERGWFKPREAPYEGAVFTVTETFWQAARARDVDPEGELTEAETEALLATHPGFTTEPIISYWPNRESAEAKARAVLDDVIDPYRCTPGELQAAAFATRRTAETLEWVVGRDTPTPFLQWRQSARVALWRAG